MSIKPVLVPDHTANDLRRLMDHFATASTGPTKKQLNESRAAVAAAKKTFAESSGAQVDMKGKKCTACKKGTYEETSQHDDMDGVLHCDKCNKEVKRHQAADSKKKRVSEGIMDVVKQTFNDCVAGYPQGTSEGQFIQGWARAIRAETGRDIPAEKLTKLYHNYTQRSPEIMQSHGTMDEDKKWTPPPSDYDQAKFVQLIQGYTPKSHIGREIQQRFSSTDYLLDESDELVGLIEEYFYEGLANGSEGPALPDERADIRAFRKAVKMSKTPGVTEGSAGAELKAIDGDYYEDSTDFFSMFDQDHFDREEESADGMEIRGYIDGKCVMVFKYSTPDMMGGWGIYDDSALVDEGMERESAGIAEVSDNTLKSYQQKVSADTMKNKLDPTKRSPEKASRSVAGVAKAHNRLEKGMAEQYNPATAIMWIDQVSQLAQSVSQLSPEELVELNDAFQGFYRVAGGVTAGAASVGIGNMFYELLKDTLYAAKNKARVDTDEILTLQRQIISIHKMLKKVKTEPAIAKYQAMLKQAYEVLAELEARQGNQVAEGHGFRGVGGARDRKDDERHDLDPSDWYIVIDGKLMKASIYPNQHDQARAEGFSPTREQARARAANKGMDEGADGAAGVKYGVFAKGGSVGSQRFRDDPLKTFDSKEEAIADARRRRSGLSKGERGYYRMGYVVKPIKGAAQQVDEKSESVRHGNNDHNVYHHVDESRDPIEQLRADIKRFAQ